MKVVFRLAGAALILVVLSTAAAAENPPDNKRPGVFELVNKMLEVEVTVRGKKLPKETADDMAAKVDGALRDCFVRQIQANEKYRVRDDKIYKSRYVLSVKAEKGLFQKVSVDSSSGSSPVMKACVKSVQGLETGYGDCSGMLAVTINTRLK
jgi:hypothetical protein